MKCPAGVSEKNGVFSMNSVEHIHAADASKLLTAKVTKKAKEIASKEVFKSARTIVSEARLNVEDANPVATIKADYIARKANRMRKGLRPEEPEDMDFEIDVSVLPEGFFRDDIKVADRRHVVFATDNQLDVLRRASRWYVDGTFKCMRAPFVMLLTIHAFVRRGDCSKQVPLVYALMTGRKTRDYVAVFESVHRILGINRVEGFVTDYEKAIWRAIRKVFPEIFISGCVFHWGQAVWRKVQGLGLATQYGQDRGTHTFIRKLLSLPFLPAEHIPPTFDALRDLNVCDAVEPLLEYIDSVWLKSSVWPVEHWCVFGQSVRTNNDVEGWHRRLNHRVGVSPAFHLLIRQLHNEAREVAEQVVLVSELCLRRIQRKHYRQSQAKLFEAWDSYRDGSLSTTGLLKKVSTVYEHRLNRPEETE